MAHTLEKALEAKLATTFELVDQRNSGYHQKGTEHSPNPVCLRSSKLNLITLTSEICLGKGKGYAKTQYIPNAPVIHVKDMYVDEKGLLHSKAETKQAAWVEQKGLESLGYNLDNELKIAKDLKIGFQFGILAVDNYGGDPALLTFLNNHHCNVDRLNKEADTKGHSGLFKFRCVQQETKAAAQLENLELELKAAEYVNSLRSKKGESYIYTDKDKAKIDATVRVLDMTSGFQPEEYSRKHLLIKQYADVNPVQFMTFLTDTFGQYKMDIGKATMYKVLDISKSGKEARIATEDADKKPVKKLILSFESDTQAGQIEELSIHFINDSGILDYKEMLMLTGLAASKN